MGEGTIVLVSVVDICVVLKGCDGGGEPAILLRSLRVICGRDCESNDASVHQSMGHFDCCK